MEKQQIALISAADLSLVENNALNTDQLKHLLKRTPKQYIKTRPAKGGGVWEYVSGGYVKKILNIMFGFDWDFEILEQLIIHDEAVIKGRLTIRTNGKTIIKTQFGNKSIAYQKGTKNPLSIGNDLKAAATDCLKKCAAEIGIAADIYNKEEFKDIVISDDCDIENELIDLLKKYKSDLDDETYKSISKVIEAKDSRNYKKAILTIQKQIKN
jgi:hypothetical protein